MTDCMVLQQCIMVTETYNVTLPGMGLLPSEGACRLSCLWAKRLP